VRTCGGRSPLRNSSANSLMSSREFA
jgi:hypothetical protein